jgi:hypothetical protein
MGRFPVDVWRQLDGTDFRLLELLGWYQRAYGVAFPRRETLAAKLKVRVETISRHVTKLVGLGVLERRFRRHRRSDGTFCTTSNVYKVLGFVGAKVRAILQPLTDVTRKRTQTRQEEKSIVSDFSFLTDTKKKTLLERFARLGDSRIT